MAFLKNRIIFAIFIVITLIFLTYEIQTFQINPENKKTNTMSSFVSIPKSNDMIPIKQTNSTFVTLYSLPNGTAPNSILVDKDGMVWLTSSKQNALYKFDPKNNIAKKYEIPGEDTGHMSWSMIQDNEGYIWFSQFGGNPLIRFNPANEVFMKFHPENHPFQMKHDVRTDNIWYTTLGDTIGLVQKINSGESQNSYKISEFPIGNETQTSGLSITGDSTLITELDKGRILKFNPIYSNNGTIVDIKKISEFPSNNMPPFSIPTDVLVEKNNTLWITEHGPSTITKFDVESQKSVRLSTAKSEYNVATLPFWLRSSLDGRGIWSNEHEGGSVVFLTNNMTFTEFHIPNDDPNSVVLTLNLAEDPSNSNKLWFSIWSLDKIGVVDKSVLIPFDIYSDDKKITFSHSVNQSLINLKIIKMAGHDLADNILHLNVSSSMDSGGDLENMTFSFSQNFIDMTNMTQFTNVQLSLNDQSLQKGEHTIEINLGNSLVTRTIFEYVTVK